MEAAAKSPALSLRDTAMFSIAASLGMRAGDIVRLTLSDIDWVHHEVRFVQGKTGVELCLPLEASVGNAIANYILHERPKTKSQVLFVRSRIPFDAMTSTAAGDRLRKYMKLPDIEYTPGDGKGFHSFKCHGVCAPADSQHGEGQRRGLHYRKHRRRYHCTEGHQQCRRREIGQSLWLPILQLL